MDITNYIQKHQKAMKHFYSLKYHTARFYVYRFIIDRKIKKLVDKLKQEDYNTKKSFIDMLFEQRSINAGIHPLMFNEIVLPVFVREYNNNDPKYINLIADCIGLVYLGTRLTEEFLKKNIIPELASIDSYAWYLFLYEKSYMLDKNQQTLDTLMSKLTLYVYTYRLDFPAWVTHPTRYMELLHPFEEGLNRCKKLCEISGNDKWSKLLADWELLVLHLYKYDEYVKNNGYVRFNDYLKEIGKKILFEPRTQEP